MSEAFSRAAHWVAQQCGRPYVFMAAVATVFIWAATGPLFGFSDTWQLIINTGTTIITFLMVFLIQNTQNRDTAAIQLKLDELIRANRNARNKMLLLEDLTEDELEKLKAAFAALAPPTEQAAKSMQHVRDELAGTEDAVKQVGEALSGINRGDQDALRSADAVREPL